VSCSG